MTNEKDLETLDPAIERVLSVIENDNPDEETREKLKKEIFAEMRRQIAAVALARYGALQ